LNAYQAALSNLDPDGPQYITSNTLDEVSHANFLNAYLESKGAEPVNFDEFRTCQGSTATGSTGIGRLTNLMQLNVDTSWFVRYRSATNPDFGATYPQAVTITNRTAIPITDADFNDARSYSSDREYGGLSLRIHRARRIESLRSHESKVKDPKCSRITLGIGGDEIAHFLEWVDFAGNGVQAPVAPVTDQGSDISDFFSPQNPLDPAQPDLPRPLRIHQPRPSPCLDHSSPER
jgi:hypothetical protein